MSNNKFPLNTEISLKNKITFLSPLNKIFTKQFRLKQSARLAMLILCLSFSACKNTVEVKTVRASKTDIEGVVSSITSGTVRAEQMADLAFGAVGRVQSLKVTLGEQVSKDTVLAELENLDLRTSLSVAEKELARQTEMRSSNASTQSEFDRARQQKELAASAYEKSLIRAPFDGIITELNLEVGQLSQITAVVPKPLIRLIDTQPRYVRAEIDEVDLPKIKEGMPTRVRILAVRPEPFTGTVRRLIRSISNSREQDRTSLLEITLEPVTALLPEGASADVDIITERKSQIVSLPSRAVLGRKGAQYVYQVIQGAITITPVKVGIRNFEITEIVEGLSAGAEIALPSEKEDLKEGTVVQIKQ